MAQILVRGLTDEEVKRLRQHAKQHERSLEAEARLAIRHAAKRPTAEEMEDFAQWAGQMRKKYAGKIKGDSADLLRELREERERQLEEAVRGSSKKANRKVG
jgi:plasmid stability protein